MIALPEYIVLDFLEWFSQNYPQNRVLLYSILNDKGLAILYAEKYLHKDYDYKQCKIHIKKYIKQVIESREFNEYLRQECKYRNCKEDNDYGMYHCLKKCYREFECLLHNKFEELIDIPSSEPERIEPYELVDSLYYYCDNNAVINNLTLMHLMVGCSSNDLSVMLDFLNWLKEQNEPFNIYKMPEMIFNDIIQKYELNREEKLSNKTKTEIVKCFSNKSSDQLLEWMTKVFGISKTRSLSYIFKRYYEDKAKYKCILLPLKGESELDKFVKRYWYDLDAASSDLLDIYYSSKELDNSGYVSLGKINDLKVDINMLPCVVIWQRDISSAKAISIRKLSYSDLFRLLSEIIYCIDKNMDLEGIYREASKMAENLKDENKMTQKVEQNFNGTNYGVVTGINNGMVNFEISSNNQVIQDDIQKAKAKINALEELDSDRKDFLCKLLDEVASSIENNDNKLKDECVKKFKAFMVGVGKISTSILGVLGSIASIAGFFGIG